MSDGSVGISVLRGHMVVPLPAQLNEKMIAAILVDVLDKVKQQTVTGIVFELSAVPILDSVMFKALRDAVRTLKLLGATTVLSGFQPGVVSSLIDLNVEMDDLRTARTLEHALEQLKATCPPEEESMESKDNVLGSTSGIHVPHPSPPGGTTKYQYKKSTASSGDPTSE
ncbi:MAG: STAS domain-containing protein [Candidatus Electrothrix sp. ATG1]|nr:STAS domain-containing protein [Candidatus Electrothrix sp. ATG1]MCI5209390.1 STAS domain-containing protein [Candidatus Electrothrix sp. ATG2]